MNDTRNERKNMVFTHLTVIEASMTTLKGDIEVDYVQSCITFKSEERVPAGKKYNVTKIFHISNTVINGTKLFQPGIYFNATGATQVMVYVHNANQECITNLFIFSDSVKR